MPHAKPLNTVDIQYATSMDTKYTVQIQYARSMDTKHAALAPPSMEGLDSPNSPVQTWLSGLMMFCSA